MPETFKPWSIGAALEAAIMSLGAAQEAVLSRVRVTRCEDDELVTTEIPPATLLERPLRQALSRTVEA